MTILEARQKSSKIKQSYWVDGEYYEFKDNKVFTARGEEIEDLTVGEVIATNWEPVLEKRKLYKVLLKRPDGVYYESATYYDKDMLLPNFGPYDQFIKFMLETEIEV